MFPERLTQALPKLLSNAGLPNQQDISKLAGDASNRNYFRISTNSQTFVAMLLAETGPNSLAEEITKTSRNISELPFIDIQKYLLKRNVRVPKIFGYDDARGVLLLEDLGDALLLEQIPSSPPAQIQTYYESALDELERISQIDPQDLRTSIAFARSFDRDLYNWEFMHFVECALDQRLTKPPSGSDRERIVSGLLAMTDKYLSWEKTFCHRDFHSRNLIVLSDGSMGVIDFQDALLAPLFYDLASLLRDSYVALEPQMQEGLVERYRMQMKRHRMKLTTSKDEFRWAFDMMGTHRNLKAAGRFCYIDQVKKNPRYLVDVPRTLTYVRNTIEQYEDLKSLRQVFLPYFDEIMETCQ